MTLNIGKKAKFCSFSRTSRKYRVTKEPQGVTKNVSFIFLLTIPKIRSIFETFSPETK